jgi:archaemetzincin
MHLEWVFGRPVVTGARAGRPAEAFDPRRRQVSSTRLLQWLVTEAPEDAERVLGVTSDDLFIPILTFVYGEAQLGGVAAVVSTARLHADPGTDRAGAIFRERFAKECAHELGHTYGLVHCARPTCVMSRSASVIDVDVKSGGLCEDCRVRLSDAKKRGRPQ